MKLKLRVEKMLENVIKHRQEIKGLAKDIAKPLSGVVIGLFIWLAPPVIAGYVFNFSETTSFLFGIGWGGLMIFPAAAIAGFDI